MGILGIELLLVVVVFLLLSLYYATNKKKRDLGSVENAQGSYVDPPVTSEVDVLMVGAGAMSTTLGMLLSQLDPELKLCMVEKLDSIALESTDALNNAGTGHAGHCELNYTPVCEEGEVIVEKALRINTYFEESLQFWSYLVEQGLLPEPEKFITQVPHYSFVQGLEDVDFLRRRFEKLSATVAFGDMEFSTDHEQLREWFPLIMQNRNPSERVGATRVSFGSDVNFGELARTMAKTLQDQIGMDIRTHRTVVDLHKQDDGRWRVEVANTQTNVPELILAKKVFLGAGGGALPLLQKSNIPEGKGYGGFPVGGQWLICKDPEIVEKHWGKVYGKAAIGAPPMSVPHLDTRIINGERCLLFGPFAGFSTKYLKTGSFWDFPKSVTAENLKGMVFAGLQNVPLTIYLVKEVLLSQEARVDSLRRFYKDASDDNWFIENAGQRVQIIKTTPSGGKLEFGTEVVSSEDGSLSALLGASPGASTAVHVMLDVLEDFFAEELEQWAPRIKEMIPSYGEDLLANDDLFRKIRAHNNKVLKLDGSSSLGIDED